MEIFDILLDIVNFVFRCPSMLSHDGVVVVSHLIHLSHKLSRI